MDAKKVLKLMVIICITMGFSIFLSPIIQNVYCEDIIIIDPEPDPELPPDIIPEEPPVTPPVEPPVEPPVTPPEEPPVIVPEGIEATINIEPNTINLRSHGNDITVRIQLPSEYDVRDIDIDTLRIVEVNGEELDQPIYDTNRRGHAGWGRGRDRASSLEVKFDRDKVEDELTVGEATIGIAGNMNDGKEFYGEDSVRVIGTHWRTHHRTKKWRFFWNIWKKHNPQWQQQTQNSPVIIVTPPPAENSAATTPEAKYLFSLSKHLSSNAQIKSVILWLKNPKGIGYSAYLDQAWHYKMLKNWEKISGRLGDLRFSNLKKGSGCEWDVTGRVAADWAQGVTNVVVKFEDEQKSGRHPYLVITYEKPAEIAAPEEAAVETQNLRSFGTKIEYKKESAEDDNSITLYYSADEVRNVDQKALSIYYWNTASAEWVPAPGCVVDPNSQSVTCDAVYSTFYRLMGPPKPVVPVIAPVVDQQKPNALGQNYPNPFNPATTIAYSIASDCQVTLKLYNTAGELVATVVDEYQTAGDHSVYYDAGESLARGIYFYQLKAGDFVDTKRMVVLK